MSISPQSLARTRDKRSLRAPARYDDFSSSDYAYRSVNFAEALKMKGKGPHHKSKVGSSNTSPDSAAQSSTSATKRSSSHSSHEPHSKRSNSTKSRNSTPAPPIEHVISTDHNPKSATKGITKNQSITDEETIQKKDDPEAMAEFIDLECRETGMDFNDIDNKRTPDLEDNLEINEDKSEFEHIKPNTETNEISKKQINITNRDTLENIDLRPSPVTKTSKKGSTTIKISSVHPSITISNGPIRLGALSKPLGEKKSSSSKHIATTISMKGSTTSSNQTRINLSPASPNTNAANQSPNLSKNSAKKKSKGFSLMVKSSSNIPLQNNTINQPNLQQQSKLNNLTPMQYGTRFLFNEPLYLPRSVGTIAPITTTLAKIANQARKRPFISERTERWFSYLEDRKIAAAIEFPSTMMRILGYLDAQDILQLRLACKSWKTIVDSDAAWKSIRILGDSVSNWQTFGDIMFKYGTKDLSINGDIPKAPCLEVSEILSKKTLLNHLTITTVNPQQNSYFLETIFNLNDSAFFSFRPERRLIWRVKVLIDEQGIAFIPLRRKNLPLSEDSRYTCLCNPKFPDWDEAIAISMMEISDVSDLFQRDSSIISVVPI